jgi:NCS1 family nucleobase:cation symporter-1
MLTAVFGHHFTDIHNAVPVSVGFTTQQFLAFFLYWLCHIPFTLLRPNQVKWLFTVKMFTVVPACIGLFIFCMVNTKAQLGNALPKSATLGGAGWFWIYAINSGIGNFANIITNQPDFARWAKYRGASIWSQLFASPISVTFAATLGILATSAINNVWGLELWNQWDLLSAIMVRYPRADVKFAVFLCAFFWAVLVMATNIAANMIAFGSDSSMLCPRYINMTRGQFLGLVLAWAMCPWKILFSAATFTNFLGGYIIFMASAVGIMIADYFFISRGNIVLKYLYSGDKTNPHYYYTYGWNIQALIAYVVGVCLPLPGFIGSLGAHVSMTATNLGHLGWCLSFVVSIVVYIAICRVWPTQNQKAMNKLNLRFEELTAEEFIYTGDAVYGRSMDRDSLDRRDDLENAVQISVSGEKKS